jgi:signal transduction histidine kinase
MKYRFLLYASLMIIIFSPYHTIYGENSGEKSSELILVSSTAFPPFSYKDEKGRMRGFLIDFWKTWSLKTGIPVRFVEEPWPESLKMIKESKADIHTGLFMTNDRIPYMSFSDYFFQMRTSLFVRSSILNDANSLQEDDIKIGAGADTAAYHLLKNKYPDINIKVYETSEDLIKGAAAGEIDAFADEELTVQYYLPLYSSLGDFKIKTVLSHDYLRAGVRRDNLSLLITINKGLDLITEEDIKKLKNKWMLENSYNLLKDWKFYAGTGAFLSFVLIIFSTVLLINRSLKKNLMERTRKLEEELEARKKTEYLLAQAQRTALSGILINGMVHDFRNILSGVSGPLSLIKIYLDKKNISRSDELNRNLNIIESSVDKAVEILNRLKSVNQTKSRDLSIIDLNKIIQSVGLLCTAAYGKEVEIIINYLEKEAPVKADYISLEQIFLNIYINGIHSMTIMDENAENKEKILNVRVVEHISSEKKAMYGVTISDTGVGMTEDVIKRLGEPFFTTKSANHGSGLGMTMVNHLISEINGRIKVESTPGKGSRFEIFLPGA